MSTVRVIEEAKAITITTSINWKRDYDIFEGDGYVIRNKLVHLQKVCDLFPHLLSSYGFYMELFSKEKETKLHFHGIVVYKTKDKIVRRHFEKALEMRFGFIKVKPLRDPEGWKEYCTKQSHKVEGIIGVRPFVSHVVKMKPWVSKFH